MRKKNLRFDQETTYFCCGLNEIGEFELDEMEYGQYQYSIYENHDKAYFATTADGQEEVAKRLEKAGFKAVAKWKREKNGHTITAWFRTPNKRKKQGEIKL